MDAFTSQQNWFQSAYELELYKNLVNAFNPELIVICGEGAELGDAYFEPMREIICSQAFEGLANELPIIVVPWDKDDFTPWAQGAASLAVQNAFDTGALEKGLS